MAEKQKDKINFYNIHISSELNNICGSFNVSRNHDVILTFQLSYFGPLTNFSPNFKPRFFVTLPFS